MCQSSNYYPEGNGLAESTNKTLVQILKKTIDKNQRNWNLKLTDALWARRLTPKDNVGMSPYTLVYGKEEKIPISLKLNALTLVVNTEDAEDSSPIQSASEFVSMDGFSLALSQSSTNSPFWKLFTVVL